MLGAGAKRVFGLKSHLPCSSGFCLSIGVQVVPTVYNKFYFHNDLKPEEYIIYLHFYHRNLVYREARDDCCVEQQIPALALSIGVHNWKNSPSASVARLLLIPKPAVMYLC